MNFFKKVFTVLDIIIFILLISVSNLFVDAFNNDSTPEENNSTSNVNNSETNECMGTGTVDDPYQISNAENLLWFSEYVNLGNIEANAVVTKNIVLNVNLLNENNELNSTNLNEWVPIGNKENRYEGIFDGQGYTISGLYYENSNKNYIGLFGSLKNGTVKNVLVKDSYFSGRQFVGGIVGENDGTIENCTFDGFVKATFEALGGIVGGNFGLIKKCTNNGKVVGGDCVNTDTVVQKDSDGNVIYDENGNAVVKTYTKTSECQALGGIAGGNYGTIDESINNGDITGGANIGGITGFNNGKISDSSNLGNVSGESRTSYGYAAGIAGYNSSVGTVYKSVNLGNINNSKLYTGGIVGYSESHLSLYVKESYNSGKVNGTMYVGGIIGYNQITVENCYNLGEVSGKRYVGGIAGFSKSHIKTTNAIANCYNAGNIICNDANNLDIGGIVGAISTGLISNCYYLDISYTSSQTINGVISKTKEIFASGEITYLLNEKKLNGVWKQNIEDDLYPYFIGPTVIYDNTNNSYYNHSHIWDYSIVDNKIIAKCNVSKCDTSDGGSITVNAPISLEYTGEAIEVEVSNDLITNDEVKIIYQADNNSTLANGKAVNVGKYNVSVTVGEKTISISYEIKPINISNAKIEVFNIIYDGTAQKPNINISYNEKKLIENEDYYIEYIDNINSGIALATFYGNENFTGTVYKSFSVYKRTVTVTANAQTIAFGKEILSTGYTCLNLANDHKINVTLTASTNKVTASGTIQIKVNDITKDGKSVISNYDIKVVPGKLIINPNLSKINDLTIYNVTLGNIDDINEVIKTVNEADYDSATEASKTEWNKVIENCNKLIEKINNVISDIERISNKVSSYNISNINSSELESIEKLIKEVNALIEGHNLNSSQREKVVSLSETLDELKNVIDEVLLGNEKINNEVKKYNINKVNSGNLEDLNKLLQEINERLTSLNISNEEKNDLTNNQKKVTEFIEKIQSTTKKINTIVSTSDNTNEKTVKTSDKEMLESLIDDINSLLKSNNIIEEEKESLISSKTNITKMLEFIETIKNLLKDEYIEKTKSITKENVLYENKDDLMKAKEVYEDILLKYSVNYTAKEVEQIKNEITRLDNALNVIIDIENMVIGLKNTFVHAMNLLIKYYK